MAIHHVISAFVFALALANIELSACDVVKAKVYCLDCHGQTSVDLSGIKVLVKCDKAKKLSWTITEDDGSFKAELPSSPTSLPSSGCLAKVLGGPSQLYATKSGMVSSIVKATDGSGRSYFTTSTLLAVSTARPYKEKAVGAKFGSSKTIDLPIPREWGLAPTSYYVPFIPIIGIP